MRAMLWTVFALALTSGPLAAQTLARRVAEAGDGAIRFSFAARPGVCAYGGGIDVRHQREDGDWESDCVPGPVRVSLRLRGGRVDRADTHVGGRWRPARTGTTDLGDVPAAEAAGLLLALARKAGPEAGGELVTAATLADSVVVWPELLRVARERELPMKTRRQAVFWLGQAAGEAAARGLDSLAAEEHGDLEVREHAVFALSQRPAGEGVPALIRIARNSPHPALRRKALFWLGQTEDPRALALFEELLTRR